MPTGRSGTGQETEMAQHIIRIGAKDHIAAIPPMNGETTWLRILYGDGTDQIHIDREAAELLRDALTQALAELEEIEQAGPTKDQLERTALDIIASRHMAALPARTQQTIRNKLADSTTGLT
jgi:hypothetical protein